MVRNVANYPMVKALEADLDIGEAEAVVLALDAGRVDALVHNIRNAD